MSFKRLTCFILVTLFTITGCSDQSQQNSPISPSPSPSISASTPVSNIDTTVKPVSYRDPGTNIEDRVQDLLSQMNNDEKIGQMVQAEASNIKPEEVAMHYIGSVLSGGK